MLFVEFSNEIAEFRTEDALQRPAFRRDDVNIQVPRPQRGRNLQTDEARADDNGVPRRRCVGDDGARVGKRAQNVDMRLIRARNLQTDRLGAGRKKQFVKCDVRPFASATCRGPESIAVTSLPS